MTTLSEFDLDTPPSVNHMYANIPGKGRIKSAEYTRWQRNQLKFLMAQKVRPVEPPVSIELRLPDTIRGDASNRIKAVEDLLVKAEIIPDDSKRYVRSVTINFHDAKLARVIVKSIGGKDG